MPLHPNYTYFYHDVTRQDINQLVTFLNDNFGDKDIDMDLNDGNGTFSEESDSEKSREIHIIRD